MSALPIRSAPSLPMQLAASGAANAWLVRHHNELVSRANAQFARLDPERREEMVAEVIARAFEWAVSAARRGRLDCVTPYWTVVFAARQLRTGRWFAGTNSRCIMSEAARFRHGMKVASLDQQLGTDGFRPRMLRESLADRNAESPFDAARRAIDYPTIFAMESVSLKAIATFEFLAQTKSEGKQCDLAMELCVTGGRITQLKSELAEALARHDYRGPLGVTPSAKRNAGV